MDLQHVNIKMFVDGELKVDPERFIHVFHQWIRDGILDELLIDVADYRHVPEGPGVLLIGYEGDYSMDHTDNRFGLRYNRKAPLDGSNEDRLRQAFCAALRACQLLETQFADEGPLKFSRREFDIFINDRALVPNTHTTYETCKPLFDSFLGRILGHNEFSLEHHDDPRSRFGVTVKTVKPFDPSAVLNTIQARA